MTKVAIGDVIVRPVETEKTVSLGADVVVFQVHARAAKGDVTSALKAFYGVNPKNVNIVKNPAKYRAGGKGKLIQRRSLLKKAIVTLKSGTKLNFNAFSA